MSVCLGGLAPLWAIGFGPGGVQVPCFQEFWWQTPGNTLFGRIVLTNKQGGGCTWMLYSSSLCLQLLSP